MVDLVGRSSPATQLQAESVPSLSSEDTDACLQCMLDAQVMIPTSVQAALVSARISLLLAAAIHHPDSFPAFFEAIRAWRTSRSQTWSPTDKSTWTVDTLHSVNEATRMEWMRTTAFNS